ncbi:HdeD family acid-resistance protein [Catellatospora methionotrophica]|uniref:HdeD family acid-resistance protein n=1 Tax=Catellatospora methionotrophica TaxID=121620 RepID=UPI0033F86E0C
MSTATPSPSAGKPGKTAGAAAGAAAGVGAHAAKEAEGVVTGTARAANTAAPGPIPSGTTSVGDVFGSGTLPASRVPWWLFLVTGVCWIIVSWFVLALNQSPVRSIGTVAALAGIVVLVAGVFELFQAFTAPGWRWLHAILGVLFLITGIICWINPGGTVFWLAAFIGWYLLFKGAADIVLAFLTKKEHDGWWLGLVVGIIEMLLGFWAAGRFTRSFFLLIVFVGAICLARGITDFIMAFRVRDLKKKAEHGLVGPGGTVAHA